MAEKKEKVEVQSDYVTIVNGQQELNVPIGTLDSWLKNGYKEKDK